MGKGGLAVLVITDLSGNSELINKFNNFEMYQELNGAFTLSFTSYRHIDNPGHDLIMQEGFVEYDGYTFRIKQLRKQINTIQVSCLSTFYDIGDVYRYDIYGGTHTLNEFLMYVLANTGWTWTVTGTIDIELSKLILNFGQNNVIQLMDTLKSTFVFEVNIDRNNQIVISDTLGPDNEFQYRYGHNIIALTESIDTTKLKTYIEGFGANGIHVTYTSPYASNPGIGIRHADPIYDDSYTDSNTLLEYIKTQLYDHPDSIFELDDAILIDKELGERVWVIHERMGIEYQARVLSRRIKIPNSLSSVVLGTYLPQSTSIINELVSQRVDIDKNNAISRSRIDQTNAKIVLEVTRLDGVDATLQSSITVTADEIRSEVSSEVTRLDGRVDSSNSVISQQADEILLRVTQDGVISAINLTPEAIRISAEKINLQGSVTFTDFNPGVNSKFTEIDEYGIYTGTINADQIIGQNGYITKLTVDELETSQKIQRYLLTDPVERVADENYIRIKDQHIQFVTASTNGLTTEHVKSRTGDDLYWLDDTHIGSAITTEVTAYPVTIFTYTEMVKRTIGFEDDGTNYIPVDIYGAGVGVGDRGKGYIRKLADGLSMEYTNQSTGALYQIKIDDNGAQQFGNGSKGLRNIAIGTTAPTSPQTNDLWIDTT
jgi:hypothetical protein